MIFGLTLAPLWAGGNHDHGHSHTKISKSKAQAIAKAEIKALVKVKKIDTSWATVAIQKTEQKMFGHHLEWVVSFNNPKAKIKAEQVIYIFLSETGELTGANFTGN